MKKTMILAAMSAMLAGAALAALDAYDTMNTYQVSLPKTATGSQSNTVCDVVAAKGVCNVILILGPSSTNNNVGTFTNSATLRTSATSGGAYTIVTNGAGTAVSATATNVTTGTNVAFKVEADKLLRYVKLYTTSNGDTSTIGAVMIAPK